MSEHPQCRNTRSVHPNYYRDKYGGYCLECSNAGVPEMEDELERGRRALEWLDDNYNWLVGQLTAEDRADLDAILDGWKP